MIFIVLVAYSFVVVVRFVIYLISDLANIVL